MRVVFATVLVLLFPVLSWAAEVSDSTAECLECHISVAPGMVAAWQNSRHARTSPGEALE